MSDNSSRASSQDLIDSPYAMLRLVVTLALMTIAGCAMYIVAVVLPTVQAEFQVARADASLPYTALMLGSGVGGILMGWLADRFGITVPLCIGALGIGAGFVLSSHAPNIWVFVFAHGVLLGLLGTSATFAPLIADTSLWFVRWRGLAVAVCASGNYLAGALWPPIVQHLVERFGWRQAYVGLGLFCGCTMLGLALLLRRRPPLSVAAGAGAEAGLGSARPFGLSPRAAQVLLCVAATACCTAMAMPQVHIVAYCGDLGYGAVKGAQMLSLMLACGIVSRLVSGAICDRIGGLRTLLLGSALQGVALLLYLPFDSLWSLYVVSAMFGLFQGGIVPAYAIIVREYFPPGEVGARVGIVMMFSLVGMALGGWLSGAVFDVTGSYHAAFINGSAWNLLNLAIVFWLWRRTRRSYA
jgi:MFS family permease